MNSGDGADGEGIESKGGVNWREEVGCCVCAERVWRGCKAGRDGGNM